MNKGYWLYAHVKAHMDTITEARITGHLSTGDHAVITLATDDDAQARQLLELLDSHQLFDDVIEARRWAKAHNIAKLSIVVYSPIKAFPTMWWETRPSDIDQLFLWEAGNGTGEQTR